MLKFVIAIISFLFAVITALCVIGACRVESASATLSSILKRYNDDINIIKSLIKKNEKETMDAKLVSTHYLAKDQSERLLLLAVDKNNLEKRLQSLHNEVKYVEGAMQLTGKYIGIALISFVIFLLLASYGGTL